MKRRKLSETEIRQRLKSLDGWEFVNGKLTKEFTTGNFAEGLNLVNRVGAVAEQLKHHPDVRLTYPKVMIETYTHDRGGITEFDFALAAEIDALYAQRS